MPITTADALELGDLLGSLLRSIVEAQAQSAKATLALVDDVGLEETDQGPSLRTVRVRYRKKDEDDQQSTFEAELPLLALINIPSFGIKEATLTFGFDVIDISTEEISPVLGVVSQPKVRIAGLVRRGSANEPDSRARWIDINVVLEQSPSSIGIQHLVDLADLGISDQPSDKKAEAN